MTVCFSNSAGLFCKKIKKRKKTWSSLSFISLLSLLSFFFVFFFLEVNQSICGPEGFRNIKRFPVIILIIIHHFGI